MLELPLATALALAAAVTLGAFLLYLRRRRRAGPRGHIADRTGEGGDALAPAERLRHALAKTRSTLRERITMEGQETGGGDYLAAVEEALLVADVGVRTTQTVLARLRAELDPGRGRNDTVQVLGRLLRDILGEPDLAGAPVSPGEPKVVLVTGVNGVGKTTTIGKLAARHINDGLRVLLVAADTFRAAAAEQLQRWAHRVGADFMGQQPGADPAAVVVDGLRAARTRGSDIVIIDTAGRLHTKKNLMEELSKVRRVAARESPGAPHETLLVLDATTGQNGLQQARVFTDALQVTGVVLTKMDGTAHGGVAVAVVADLGIPIRFVGVGEGPQDLAPFDARDFVDALLEPERKGTEPAD